MVYEHIYDMKVEGGYQGWKSLSRDGVQGGGEGMEGLRILQTYINILWNPKIFES